METFHGHLFTYSLELRVPVTGTLDRVDTRLFRSLRALREFRERERAPVENRLEARRSIRPAPERQARFSAPTLAREALS